MKQQIQFIILIFLFPVTLLTQIDSTNVLINDSDSSVKVTVMPMFRGCEKVEEGESELCTSRSISNFVARNYLHPAIAKEHGIKGRVYIRFVINKYGYVQNIEILKSAHRVLEEPCIAAVKKLPRFIPARNDVGAVNVYFTLPINITYDDKKTKKELRLERKEARKKAKRNS
jgi:TonB family protein